MCSSDLAAYTPAPDSAAPDFTAGADTAAAAAAAAANGVAGRRAHVLAAEAARLRGLYAAAHLAPEAMKPWEASLVSGVVAVPDAGLAAAVATLIGTPQPLPAAAAAAAAVVAEAAAPVVATALRAHRGAAGAVTAGDASAVLRYTGVLPAPAPATAAASAAGGATDGDGAAAAGAGAITPGAAAMRGDDMDWAAPAVRALAPAAAATLAAALNAVGVIVGVGANASANGLPAAARAVLELREGAGGESLGCVMGDGVTVTAAAAAAAAAAAVGPAADAREEPTLAPLTLPVPEYNVYPTVAPLCAPVRAHNHPLRPLTAAAAAAFEAARVAAMLAHRVPALTTASVMLTGKRMQRSELLADDAAAAAAAQSVPVRWVRLARAERMNPVLEALYINADEILPLAVAADRGEDVPAAASTAVSVLVEAGDVRTAAAPPVPMVSFLAPPPSCMSPLAASALLWFSPALTRRAVLAQALFSASGTLSDADGIAFTLHMSASTRARHTPPAAKTAFALGSLRHLVTGAVLHLHQWVRSTAMDIGLSASAIAALSVALDNAAEACARDTCSSFSLLPAPASTASAAANAGTNTAEEQALIARFPVVPLPAERPLTTDDEVALSKAIAHNMPVKNLGRPPIASPAAKQKPWAPVRRTRASMVWWSVMTAEREVSHWAHWLCDAVAGWHAAAACLGFRALPASPEGAAFLRVWEDPRAVATQSATPNALLRAIAALPLEATEAAAAAVLEGRGWAAVPVAPAPGDGGACARESELAEQSRVGAWVLARKCRAVLAVAAHTLAHAHVDAEAAAVGAAATLGLTPRAACEPQAGEAAAQLPLPAATAPLIAPTGVVVDRLAALFPSLPPAALALLSDVFAALLPSVLALPALRCTVPPSAATHVSASASAPAAAAALVTGSPVYSALWAYDDPAQPAQCVAAHRDKAEALIARLLPVAAAAAARRAVGWLACVAPTAWNAHSLPDAALEQPRCAVVEAAEGPVKPEVLSEAIAAAAAQETTRACALAAAPMPATAASPLVAVKVAASAAGMTSGDARAVALLRALSDGKHAPSEDPLPAEWVAASTERRAVNINSEIAAAAALWVARADRDAVSLALNTDAAVTVLDNCKRFAQRIVAAAPLAQETQTVVWAVGCEVFVSHSQKGASDSIDTALPILPAAPLSLSQHTSYWHGGHTRARVALAKLARAGNHAAYPRRSAACIVAGMDAIAPAPSTHAPGRALPTAQLRRVRCLYGMKPVPVHLRQNFAVSQLAAQTWDSFGDGFSHRPVVADAMCVAGLMSPATQLLAPTLQGRADLALAAALDDAFVVLAARTKAGPGAEVWAAAANLAASRVGETATVENISFAGQTLPAQSPLDVAAQTALIVGATRSWADIATKAATREQLANRGAITFSSEKLTLENFAARLVRLTRPPSLLALYPVTQCASLLSVTVNGRVVFTPDIKLKFNIGFAKLARLALAQRSDLQIVLQPVEITHSNAATVHALAESRSERRVRRRIKRAAISRKPMDLDEIKDKSGAEMVEWKAEQARLHELYKAQEIRAKRKAAPLVAPAALNRDESPKKTARGRPGASGSSMRATVSTNATSLTVPLNSLLTALFPLSRWGPVLSPLLTFFVVSTSLNRDDPVAAFNVMPPTLLARAVAHLTHKHKGVASQPAVMALAAMVARVMRAEPAAADAPLFVLKSDNLSQESTNLEQFLADNAAAVQQLPGEEAFALLALRDALRDAAARSTPPPAAAPATTPLPVTDCSALRLPYAALDAAIEVVDGASASATAEPTSDFPVPTAFNMGGVCVFLTPRLGVDGALTAAAAADNAAAAGVARPMPLLATHLPPHESVSVVTSPQTAVAVPALGSVFSGAAKSAPATAYSAIANAGAPVHSLSWVPLAGTAARDGGLRSTKDDTAPAVVAALPLAARRQVVSIYANTAVPQRTLLPSQPVVTVFTEDANGTGSASASAWLSTSLRQMLRDTERASGVQAANTLMAADLVEDPSAMVQPHGPDYGPPGSGPGASPGAAGGVGGASTVAPLMLHSVQLWSVPSPVAALSKKLSEHEPLLPRLDMALTWSHDGTEATTTTRTLPRPQGYVWDMRWVPGTCEDDAAEELHCDDGDDVAAGPGCSETSPRWLSAKHEKAWVKYATRYTNAIVLGEDPAAVPTPFVPPARLPRLGVLALALSDGTARAVAVPQPSAVRRVLRWAALRATVISAAATCASRNQSAEWLGASIRRAAAAVDQMTATGSMTAFSVSRDHAFSTTLPPLVATAANPYAPIAALVAPAQHLMCVDLASLPALALRLPGPRALQIGRAHV